MVELLSIEAIQGALQGYWRVSILDETPSTMNNLKSSETEPWDLVAAEFQSAGRGRLDRKFESPKNSGLLFSFYVETKKDQKYWGFIPLLIGKVVAATLNEFSGQTQFKTKWPNDVLVKDKKISGVLVETYKSGLIIGVGINISNQVDQLPVPTATSFFLETGELINRNILLAKILNRFREVFTTWESGGDFVNSYLASSATIGEEVEIYLPGDEKLSGRAIGVNQSGALILEGGEEVTVGDVVHLRATKISK